MRNRLRPWLWLAAFVGSAGLLLLVVLPRLDAARSDRQARRDGTVPGQLVVEESSEDPAAIAEERYDAYVQSVRAIAGATLDEDDRLDSDDLIAMGRRVCFHLTRSAIGSTRDYVRTYRMQRRAVGYPVYKRLLVQGAAVAEIAPVTFCPEHVGAVSAREAAAIVGFDDDNTGLAVP